MKYWARYLAWFCFTAGVYLLASLVKAAEPTLSFSIKDAGFGLIAHTFLTAYFFFWWWRALRDEIKEE